MLSSCPVAVRDIDVAFRLLTQACRRLRTEAVQGEGRLDRR